MNKATKSKRSEQTKEPENNQDNRNCNQHKFNLKN